MAGLQRPNRTLRGLLAESDWTQDRLAQRVVNLAAENSHEVRLDRRSVSHWLAGRTPRSPTAELVAEAFSRELGRTITITDVGFASTAPPPAASSDAGSGYRSASAESSGPWQRDPVCEVTKLANLQTGRRRILTGAVYSLAALEVPGWAQATTTSRQPPPPGPGKAEPIGPGQVAGAHADVAEALTRVFAQDNDAFGGGHARPALAAYLSADLVPRLGAPAGPALRRRLLTAATELTYLCASMCFDEELHGLAQRYYRATLRMAADNADAAAYAITLRGMSVQARSLGHYRAAVQLAEAATTDSGKIEPVRQAFLLGQLAVAHAAEGNRAHAIAHLSDAERRLDVRSSSSTGSSIGCYHYAALAHQQAAVRSLLGDRQGAISALTVSARYRPAAERCSRAIILARLAELQLHVGHLEEAATTWHQFLDDYPSLKSGRAATALKNLRSHLRPYARNPAARVLLHRATNLSEHHT